MVHNLRVASTTHAQFLINNANAREDDWFQSSINYNAISIPGKSYSLSFALDLIMPNEANLNQSCFETKLNQSSFAIYWIYSIF